MSAPSRATPAGRAYLDLRNKARHDRRPVDELLQLYVLEGFLARLAASGRAGQFVLKGGVLLAALDERRPTRDVDLQAEALDNDAEVVRARRFARSPAAPWTTGSHSTWRRRPQRLFATRSPTRACE